MKKKPLKYYFGNALMAFSLILLLFIYYPLTGIFFIQKDKSISNTGQFALIIPKLNIYSPIISGVDPFNSRVYHDVLTRGVALSNTGVLPDERGTVYIFAHSSDLPWRITRYNTIFFRLGELKLGDLITIFYKYRTYSYYVTGQKTVWPSEISYITNINKNQLILQTCTPIGTDWQRLLVFAKPI